MNGSDLLTWRQLLRGLNVKKSTVIQFFGSGAAVARALGIRRAAVSQWPNLVPIGRAYEIQALTNGAVLVDRALYEKPSCHEKSTP